MAGVVWGFLFECHIAISIGQSVISDFLYVLGLARRVSDKSLGCISAMARGFVRFHVPFWLVCIKRLCRD